MARFIELAFLPSWLTFRWDRDDINELRWGGAERVAGCAGVGLEPEGRCHRVRRAGAGSQQVAVLVVETVRSDGRVSAHAVTADDNRPAGIEIVLNGLRSSTSW